MCGASFEIGTHRGRHRTRNRVSLPDIPSAPIVERVWIEMRVNPNARDDVVMNMTGERQLIEARLIEPIASAQVAALVATLARAEFRRLHIRLILDQRGSLVGIVIPRRILAEVGLRAAGDADRARESDAP
jgi:hypothetical protein